MIKIKYGDVAPEAKENFVVSVNEKESFIDLTELNEYNINVGNYANPCELYQTVLDGKQLLLPSDIGSEKLGYWSESISDEDGNFENPIVFTFVADGQYSSQGITLTFDTNNNIFCNDLTIDWYRDEELLHTEDFIPDTPMYFCRQQVNNYNKLIITMRSINMPYNRLRLRAIDYGYGTFFMGDELRSVKINNEVDPISNQISINTVDFTLDSNKSDMEYSFQAKQPLSVYNNDILLATTFVRSSNRKSRYIWDVQSEDYIGLMEDVYFHGGIYNNKNAVQLLSEIFTTAKVPFEISEDFDNSTVTGYIPYCSCREALMQVAFAIIAVVDTAYSDKVKVFKLPNTPSQTIPLKRIRQGQNFTNESTVTGIDLTVHSYTMTEELEYGYRASESGTGDNIYVVFSEPLGELEIVNGDIIENSENHAVINARNGCQLFGKKYEHTTRIEPKRNPVVLATEKEKVIQITSPTLISEDNAVEVLEACYNSLTKTTTTNLKIIEGKTVVEGFVSKYGDYKYGTTVYGYSEPTVITYDDPVHVGDYIIAETEYLGEVEGNILSESFSLIGGITIKDVKMK